MSITTPQKALLHTGTLIIAWALLFQTTLLDLIEAWQSSDTFQHCFIIAPIALWLLWRRRFMLAEVNYHPTYWLLIPTLLSGLLWYAGTLTGIQIVAQFAAICWLFFAVWCLLGNGFFRTAWFPMCYLFFMLPIGDEIVPQLQVVTADISVVLLSWTGIPVFREGLYIAIPNGLFEVAVACSGIRYLIASIALGTLFAHLQFHSLKRQFIFVVIAAIVPIIANGIRAYFIVLIAHLSDMKLATGVDHLLYGWVFFGMVMFLLFWLGSFWRQSQADPITQTSKEGLWVSGKQSALVALVLVSSAAATIGYENYLSERIPPALTLNQTQLSELFEPSELSQWKPDFINADDYFTGHALIEGVPVEVYIAFYKQNRQGHELVNFGNQLFNKESWTPESHTSKPLEKGSVGHYLITSIKGEKYQIRYWYQLEDLISSSASEVKLTQSWNTLLATPPTGAVIVLATRGDTSSSALEKAQHKLMALPTLWQKGTTL